MKKTLLLLPLLLFLYSCPNSSTSTDDNKDNAYAEELMKDVYYWYDKITPLSKDINSYGSPQEVFDEMAYEKDEWSYVAKKATDDAYYQESKVLSYGIFIGGAYNYYEDEYSYRVFTIQEDSEFYSKGVRRGDEILKIDEFTSQELLESEDKWNIFYNRIINPEVEMTFKINSSVNGIVTIKTKQREISMKTANINFTTEFIRGDKTIAYLPFTSFVEKSRQELNSVFDKFSNKGVNEIIIDLRWNGGGLIDIAKYFADILIGDRFDGEVFTNFAYNPNYSEWNNSSEIEDAGFDFNFQRVIFLTNDYTASSSELLINGLKPYIDVYVIGSRSAGKFMGMNGFEDGGDYIYWPITFMFENANNANYNFRGIPVDSFVRDSYSHDYGDENDPLISEAISYIENGRFIGSSRSIESMYKTKSDLLRGFNRVKGFY